MDPNRFRVGVGLGLRDLNIFRLDFELKLETPRAYGSQQSQSHIIFLFLVYLVLVTCLYSESIIGLRASAVTMDMEFDKAYMPSSWDMETRGFSLYASKSHQLGLRASKSNLRV